MHLQVNIGPKRHMLEVLATAVERSSDVTGSVWPKNAMVCFLILFSYLCCRVLTVVTAEYKPILEEVEKILAEAGLDDKEMREMSRDVSGVPSGGQSRNRR